MQEILSMGEDVRKQVLLNTVRAGINSENFLAVSTMYHHLPFVAIIDYHK